MPNDHDDEDPEPVTAVVVEPPNMLAPVEKTGPPALVDHETLVTGFRHLQQRIAGFTQLSLDEQRSMTRAAYLDPEFVTAGIHAAGVWERSEALIKRPVEALRQDEADIRRGDELEREVLALAKGIHAANLKRKHRLGQDILTIYKMLGLNLQGSGTPGSAHMRPYFEEMQRLYKRNIQKKPRKPKAKKPDPEKE